MIWSTKDISKGSSILISYGKGKSYFDDGLCLCATCIIKPLEVKPKTEPPQKNPNKKPKHRSGKKLRARREKDMARKEKEGGQV